MRRMPFLGRRMLLGITPKGIDSIYRDVARLSSRISGPGGMFPIGAKSAPVLALMTSVIRQRRPLLSGSGLS